jgi:hypothetical protein
VFSTWHGRWQRPLGRPRHRWENNIEIDLKEMVWGGVDWSPLPQDKDQWWVLVKTMTNLRLA